MPCSRFRTALSARADDEALPPDVTGPAVDAHVGACSACRRFADGIWRLRDTVLAGLAQGDDGSEGDPAVTDVVLARVHAQTDGRTGARNGGSGGTRAR
ncbi:zf-HC2 domain-containing protein [Streptomyces sp. NPDC051776]|uniref:zf-HC2 domain-containing protein n=1 Tax=Streptomyces sp. NPDC051776 TaxID=3155414 RepID=UPI00342AE702